MTKESAKAFMENPAIKFAGYVAGLCSLYFGLRSEIRENKATQTGVDNVQNLRIEQSNQRIDQQESDLMILIGRFDAHVNRAFTKPDDVKIESD